jgi:hypothetical protein
MGSVVERAALAANGTTTISLPAFFEPQQIHVSTSDGFVPADVEPGSRDQRLLGCWIEIR